MKTIAYIQKVGGEFPNINFLTAYIALKRFFGYRIVFFENVEEILDYVTKETIVFGGIPVMDKVFKRLGVNPIIPYYPYRLIDFTGRKVWKMSVKNVRHDVENGAAFFVKPVEEMKKSFNGMIMSKFLHLLPMHHLDEDVMVWCSEIIKLESEYRCYIHREQGVLGCKHYAGDWKKMIDTSLPEVMRHIYYDKSPIAYSIDLGVTDKGETVLVECNDALSLGCYGLDPSLYGCMIVDRWKEIMNEPR